MLVWMSLDFWSTYLWAAGFRGASACPSGNEKWQCLLYVDTGIELLNLKFNRNDLGDITIDK